MDAPARSRSPAHAACAQHRRLGRDALGPPGEPAVELADARRAREAIFEQLSLAPTDLAGLRALPAEPLLRAYVAATRKYGFNHVVTGFAPVVDGSVFVTSGPQPPTATIAANAARCAAHMIATAPLQAVPA